MRLKEYLAEIERTKSPQTVKAYMGTLARFLEFSKGEVNKETAKRFLLSFSLKKTKATSFNRHLAALKHYFKFLGQKLDIEWSRTIKYLPRWLSIEEEKLYKSACQTPEEEAIIYTLLGSGVRISELCSLLRKGVKPISAKGGYLEVLGKGGAWRTVAVKEEVITAISKYLFTRSDSNPRVFPFQVRTYQKKLESIGKRIGLDVHPHLLRHTYGSHTLAGGVSLATVRDQMGHRDIRTTEIYLHTLPEERLEEIMRKV